MKFFIIEILMCCFKKVEMRKPTMLRNRYFLKKYFGYGKDFVANISMKYAKLFFQ